ncbi:MAG: hypothetical protein D6692_01445 [Planctomycetota bacterium]|nr:MAG: hypothetical protein D6692_01445 [Planctomycetota bacterium]
MVRFRLGIGLCGADWAIGRGFGVMPGIPAGVLGRWERLLAWGIRSDSGAVWLGTGCGNRTTFWG